MLNLPLKLLNTGCGDLPARQYSVTRSARLCTVRGAGRRRAEGARGGRRGFSCPPGRTVRWRKPPPPEFRPDGGEGIAEGRRPLRVPVSSIEWQAAPGPDLGRPDRHPREQAEQGGGGPPDGQPPPFPPRP